MLIDLTIRNYKSLRAVHLQSVPPFSIMVGANASGKSNFADALDFLSLVVRNGLASAVRAKGGYENVCFRAERRSKAGIEFDATLLTRPARRRRMRESDVLRFRYTFSFKADTRAIGSDYKVTSERIAVSLGQRYGPEASIERTADADSRVTLSKQAETELDLPPREFLSRFVKEARVPEDELILPTRLGDLMPFWSLSTFLAGCRVYQISPEMARRPGIPERSPELGRHGDNLPAAVQYLKNKEKDAFEDLESHLKHAVSTMYSLDTDYVETKELGLFFKERGVGRRWYAQDVSDGTLKTVSMFLPLVDPRVTIVVIEEPENSLHPWILRHFIEVCKATSSAKQIFLTTHSPVAVDEAPIESLFIVARREGKTQIERLDHLYPEARAILREELYGLGAYWDSGGVGGVPESAPGAVSD